MIKLAKILSEIKIRGSITPELIDQAEEDIFNKLTGEQQRELIRFYEDLGWIGLNLLWIDWLKTLDKKTLQKIYNHLLELKQKYNL